jgi:GNAT superfamily N-acetyltransferase
MELAAEIKIRPAVEADAAAVAACLERGFAPYREFYSPAAFSDTVPDAAGVRLRLRQMHVLVATVGEEIVGTVSGTSSGVTAHLRGMAVVPEWHGQSVAAKLLGAIEHWARSRGSTGVTLDTTLPLQAAMKFYEKNGYRRSGRTSDFFGMPLIEYSKGL